jgi:class 3 adenylate cyclase
MTLEGDHAPDRSGRPASRSGDAESRSPILRLRTGAQVGAALAINKPTVLGREADIAIDDHEISRRHARIRHEGEDLVVEDLGSSNGTWVNGNRVERAVLRPGDVLTLGRTIIDVVRPEDAASTGPSRAPSLATAIGSVEVRPAPVEGQLRPITALFADVVGSTALGERLDPDEISTLIGECVSRMCVAVERFGGVVSSYMGDGIAAFFGFDQASEQDPELAAQAALSIISEIGRYAGEVQQSWGIADFNVRVGLNTGDAAVGAVGAAERANVALGDTTNVAARLQSLADPGTIAVGDETARGLRSRYVLEPLGEVSVKGRQARVRAWRLLGALDRPTMPEQRRLVGREAELTVLRSVTDAVFSGDGRVLFLVGDLGVGKTRLLAELESIVDRRAVVLQAFCAAAPVAPPYGPFASMLRSWLGTERDEPAPSVRIKLRSRLESLGGDASGSANGLAVLLDLGHDHGVRQPTDPVAAYLGWMEALAARGPVLVALDDIHWLEPSSAALALSLAELAMRVPLLFVSTLRPERESHGWQIRTSARVAHPTRAKEMDLRPLSEEQTRELISELDPRTDPTTRDEVIRRAEGNPLFVEQLLRASREGGSFLPGQSSVRTVATARLLPPALASVFVGRIDRLPEEVREVAQIAAAIGRTFSKRLLVRVVDRAKVESAMPMLVEAGIVADRDPEPEPSWSFTHALLRDAVLSTLVRSRRREIFNRVATAFEDSVAAARDEHLELLAYYYARSDDSAKALHYQERAAQRAFRVGADTEASDRLMKAAQLAAELEDDEAATRIATQLRRYPKTGPTA